MPCRRRDQNQVPPSVALELGCWEEPNSLLFDWDADRPPPHSLTVTKTLFVPRTVRFMTGWATTPPSAHAQEARTADTTRWLTSSTKPSSRQGSVLRKRKQGSNNLVNVPGSTDPPTFGLPEAWDFALTSCLRPAPLDPTMRRTANRCQQHGIRFTPVVFDGHAGGWGDDSRRNLVTRINVSAPPLPAHPATSIPNLQRISSSIHRDSARVILRRVRLTASRDAPLSLGSDDWWAAWDDSGSNE